jgi:hypothetical protein
MAVAALIVSALVVVFVSLCSLIFRNYGAGAAASIACLLTGVFLACMGVALFPVGFTALGLLLVCLACLRRTPKSLEVSVIGLVVLFLAMGGGVLMSRSYVNHLGMLRETYPLVSVASRLDYESKGASGRPHRSGAEPASKFGPPPLGSPAWGFLDAPEEAPRHWSQRAWALETIHASKVEQFVDAPGFGVTRMSSVNTYAFENNRRPATSLPGTTERYLGLNQAGPLRAVPLHAAPYHTTRTEGERLELQLREMHELGRRDFVDPEDTGWVVDRDHVAGFVPHRFSEEFRPNQQTNFELQCLQLVSLRKFGHPMVYVTNKNLPRMDKLQDVPTRELNSFEAAALESLAKGEELCYVQSGRRVLAPGALRARDQCTKCHDVQRGALLGAFSYEFLGNAPPAKPPI